MVISDPVFERFFAICPDMLALADFDGRFKLLNPSWEKNLGFTPAELKEMSLFDVVHIDDRAELSRAIEGLARGRQGVSLELRCRCKDGSCRALEVSASTSPRDHSLYLIARELKPAREAGHKSLQQRKYETVGRLSLGLAHDFNNIITTILGYCDFLGRSLRLQGQEQKDFEEIRGSAKRAADLIRRLLAYSRKDAQPPAAARLNDVASDLERLLRRLLREDIELACELDPELPPVVIDLGQIEQTVIDLVVSAAESMPKGGRILLKTARSNEAGGFGPACASMTVAGGRDAVTLHFPFAERAQTAATAPPPRGTEMILIVEDEASVREVMRRALTHWGYKVMLAQSAEEGLTVLGSTEGKDIRLMITDLVMPGMDGIELVRRVRETNPNIPVIFMSGYTDQTEAVKELTRLKVTILQKPFLPDGLAQRVREALGPPEPAAGG